MLAMSDELLEHCEKIQPMLHSVTVSAWWWQHNDLCALQNGSLFLHLCVHLVALHAHVDMCWADDGLLCC